MATLDPENILILMDKFLEIYNKKHRTSGSMFDNVDIKDPTTTNERMEIFYEYMQEYQNLYEENKDFIDVYGPDDKIENSGSHDIYALVTGESSKIIFLSLSFISLLVIGCISAKNDKKMQDMLGKNWSIIKL